MRNIQVVNLLKRLSYSNTSRTLITSSKSVSILNSTSSNQHLDFTLLKQSKRYSSHESNKSEFSKTAIVYSVIGASIFGVTMALYFRGDNSKKELKSTVVARPATQAKNEEPEEPEQTEEKEEPNTPVTPAAPATPKIESSVQVVKKEEPKVVQNDSEQFLPEIPSHAQYLIVGGGTAAMAAFKAIRASDPNARVLIVTEEKYKPYMRPPLSKDLWSTDDESLLKELKFKQYNGNERSLYFLEDEFYVNPKYLNQQENGGVAVVTGKRVNHVDIVNKTARLDNNWEIAYDKCLIATGGRPKNLPIFEKRWDELKDKVTLFRNIEDFNRLYSIVKQGKTIAIVGGGFLGSELACAIGNLSKKYGGSVVQLFPESGNLRRILPEYLSEWTTNKVKDEGVTVVSNANVVGARLNDDKVELNIEPVGQDGPKARWLLADHVVVAVGLDANVQLASSSHLEIDSNFGGYVVNAELQARNSVWVAGDAACFYDVKLGRRRVEHHDHAVVSGRLAGENMTGAGKPYWHQSMFWSDLGPKIGFEAIGLVDSSLQTVGLFAKADENDSPQALVNESNEALRSEINQLEVSALESNQPRVPTSRDDYGKGVILYLKNDVIVGVLLWNVFKRIPIARQLIQSQTKLTDYKEMAKLFHIDATGLEESNN